MTLNCSPLPRLVAMKLLFLDEVEVGEYAKSTELGLVSKEDIMCFVALTLVFLQKDAPRQEELKV